MLGDLVTYSKYIAVLIVIILPVMYLIKKYPDISFWVLINIGADPGGYVGYYMGSRIFSLTTSDIVIWLILYCLYTINANYKIIYKDQLAVSFLKIFWIWVAYYFIVYGGIVPFLNNDLNYSLFLQKNRYFFYSIIMFFATYIFVMRGVKYFYITTAFIGFILLSLFLITLATGINLVPVLSEERYEGSGIMRLGFNAGLTGILFPISFIIFLLPRKIKLNIKYKKIVYAAGTLMLMTLLIALTRRYFISIPAMFLINVILISFIFRKSTALGITKILIPIGIALLIINFTLPKYVDYIAGITQDTFGLLTTGKDTRGEQDYRVSGTSDLEITKKYINDNIFFGTGWTWIHWVNHGAVTSRGSVYAAAMDAAGEVPIYYIFFGYGITGFIIMVFLYSYYIRLFFRLYSLVKKRINVLTEFPYELIFIVMTLQAIIDKFTFGIWGLGTDFSGFAAAGFLGAGFAYLQKFKVISKENEIKANVQNELQEITEIKSLNTFYEK